MNDKIKSNELEYLVTIFITAMLETDIMQCAYRLEIFYLKMQLFFLVRVENYKNYRCIRTNRSVCFFKDILHTAAFQ